MYYSLRPKSGRLGLAIVLLFVSFSSYASATHKLPRINDNNYAAVNYTSLTRDLSWNQNAHNESCKDELKDSKITWNRTWHGLSRNERGGDGDETTKRLHVRQVIEDGEEPSFTLTFNGTAISVYFIVPNNASCTSNDLRLRFQLDGQDEPNYNHSTTGAMQFLMNVQVYSRRNLEDKSHNLTIINQGNASAIFFDYAKFTSSQNTPDAAPPQPSSTPRGSPIEPPTSTEEQRVSSKPSTGVIVGSVIGGLVLGLLTAITSIFYCRRRKIRGANNSKRAQQVNPYSWRYREIHSAIERGVASDEGDSKVAQVGIGVRVDEKRRSLFREDPPYVSYAPSRDSGVSYAPTEDELQRRLDDAQSTSMALTYVTVPSDAVTQVPETRHSIMSNAEPRAVDTEEEAGGISPRRAGLTRSSSTEQKLRRIAELHEELARVRQMQEQLRVLKEERRRTAEASTVLSSNKLGVAT